MLTLLPLIMKLISLVSKITYVSPESTCAKSEVHTTNSLHGSKGLVKPLISGATSLDL